jgi:hypothetical protein
MTMARWIQVVLLAFIGLELLRMSNLLEQALRFEGAIR